MTSNFAKGKFFIIIIAFSMSLGLVACATPDEEPLQSDTLTQAETEIEEAEAGDASKVEADAELIELKVVTVPFLGFAPFFIAQEEGFFLEQGLDVEFIEMFRTADSIPALLQGDLDMIGTVIDVGTLNAISQGSTLRVVSDRGFFDPDSCAYQGLVARTELLDSGALNSAADLQDLNVSANPVSFAGYYLARLCTK